MFEIEWADETAWRMEANPTASEGTLLDRRTIASVLKIKWEEHCVECAVPECYSSCALYQQRKDTGCARFAYGIVRNDKFTGHYNFGADVKFRKWGKLEANLNFAFPGSLLPHYLLTLFTRLPIRCQIWLLNKTRRYLNRKVVKIDEFVLECYSFHDEPFNLLIEYFIEQQKFRTTKFRHLFNIRKGRNFFTVPFEAFNMSSLEGYVYLYPENSGPEKRLIFTWLDFIRYKHKTAGFDNIAKKIKCVAWDLDNTVWSGTLAEDTNVEVRPAVRNLMAMLDARGIVQTIVSKNHFDSAWNTLKRAGLFHYFLYPAINWGQKSENLIRIAQKLNIGIDSFAVIDDSSFEREEIKRALPQVRTYSETEIDRLLGYEEFDLPITSFSRSRRLSYQSGIERSSFEGQFSGSYEEFLSSCKMVMEIFKPEIEDDIQRILELIQRSNQLNMSSKRYTIEELRTTLTTPSILSLAWRCSDKFGDYGIVGFATVNMIEGQPVLEDLLLSCRVARKKVEHTFIKYLSNCLRKKGFANFSARIIKTEKNSPLIQVFKDLPFQLIFEENNLSFMQMDLTKEIMLAELITIRDRIGLT